MHVDPDALLRALERLRGPARDDASFEQTILQVVRGAVGLFQMSGAGIMAFDDARVLRHIMSTDHHSDDLEEAQEQAGQGPCVDAVLNDVTVSTVDVGTDLRWPKLGPFLAHSPIKGVLGVPIHLGGASIGALNVFVDRPYEWDDSDIAALCAFAEILESALGAAVLAGQQEDMIRQLQRALDGRVTIERAVGVLMGRHDLEAVEAFDMLRKTARAERRKVVDLAADLLAGKQLPGDI